MKRFFLFLLNIFAYIVVFIFTLTIVIKTYNYIEKEVLILKREQKVEIFKDKVSNYKSRTVYDKHGNEYKTVISPYTGRIWLDRNLGAKKVCEFDYESKCYGDYFQWGRDSDGHEKLWSKKTEYPRYIHDKFLKTGNRYANAISDTPTPNHSKFIISCEGNRYDWVKDQNDTLWQGVNGVNNPCPKGFRVPTIDELKYETLNMGFLNSKEVFDNFLKIPDAGHKYSDDGYPRNVGADITRLWSSTTKKWDSSYIGFHPTSGQVIKYGSRAYGIGVRCIKD